MSGARPAPAPRPEAAALPGSADAAARRGLRRHWRKTRLLTAALLCLWLAVTLGLCLFARELAGIRFFGWPLSYYMGAQGALIVFLLIIGCHCLVMNRLDRELHEEAGRGRGGEPR